MMAVSAIAGNVYYVDGNNGSDHNTGLSTTSAWKSLDKANSSVQAGDTVYIREAVYNDRIYPQNSGTEGAMITYKAYENEEPVIDRSELLTGWNLHSGSIYWTNYSNEWAIGIWEDTYEQSGYYCDYWIRDSLQEVDGPGKYWRDTTNRRYYVWTKDGDNPNSHTMRTSVGGGTGFSRNYVVVDGISFRFVTRGADHPGSYCIFKNLKIEYALAFGINVGGHHNQILDNVIFHVGSWYRDEGDGIHLNNYSHHNLVSGNDVSLTAHNPITSKGQAYGPAHHNIVQNNIVHDSGSSGLNPNRHTYNEVWRFNISYSNTGAGIQTDAQFNIVSHNLLYDNVFAGILLYAVNGEKTENNRFFNNVCANNNDEGIFLGDWGGTCSNNVFLNNILYNNNATYEIMKDFQLENELFSYNTVYRTSGAKVRVTTTGVQSLNWFETNHPVNFNNNSQTDPKMNGSFKPGASSVCIDGGTFLTKAAGAGSGTSLVVEDARVFTDGLGLIEGDQIQLEGQSQRARITSVDYNSNRLTLDTALTWYAGQGVSLPYSGSRPDIGVYEKETAGSGAPEINIRLAGQNLKSGASYNLGQIPLSQFVGRELTFTIENDGTDNLNLTGNPAMVTISGQAAKYYKVSQQPLTGTVQAGSSTTFKVRTKISKAPDVPEGWKQVIKFKVSIPNNDDNEALYSFTVKFKAVK